MTVIPIANSLIDETDSAIKLAHYAQLAGFSEDQFFGLNNPSTVRDSCHPIWTHAERQMIARYLKEAQEEIEQVTRFPLTPRWFTDEFAYYGYPVHTKWMKVIEGGFKNSTTITSGVAVSYATDPSVVVVVTTITDEDEIQVFHPGTDIPIIPSAIVTTGLAATIYIPRARLVEATSVNNPADGWDYSDVPPSATSPFTMTVDVRRVFNDDSIDGGLIWAHRDSAQCLCGCLQCCGTCGEYTQSACIYVRNAETGAVELTPGAWSNAAWTAACPTCYCENPTSVRLNYRAGMNPTSTQAEDAIIRLAHAKMPSPPCGCGVVNEMWTRDRNIPAVLDAKRLDCPFGLSDGAWVAWRFANAMASARGFAM